MMRMITESEKRLNALRVSAVMEGDASCIGWHCPRAPRELLHAAGLRAMRLSTADMRGVREMDAPSMMGFLEIPCSEGMRLEFEIAFNGSDAPLRLLVDAPRKDDAAARRYLLQRLTGMKEAIELGAGLKIAKKELTKAIREGNRLREAMRRLDKARAIDPGRISNGEFYELLLLCLDAPLSLALETISALRGHSVRKSPKRRRDITPIALCGSYIEDRAFFNAIDTAGGGIVSDDLCIGSRFFSSDISIEGDHLEAIADWLLSSPACPRMIDDSGFAARFLEKAVERGARGLIITSRWGCEDSAMDRGAVAREAEKAALPSITVDVDSVQDGKAEGELNRFMELIAE